MAYRYIIKQNGHPEVEVTEFQYEFYRSLEGFNKTFREFDGDEWSGRIIVEGSPGDSLRI